MKRCQSLETCLVEFGVWNRRSRHHNVLFCEYTGEIFAIHSLEAIVRHDFDYRVAIASEKQRFPVLVRIIDALHETFKANTIGVMLVNRNKALVNIIKTNLN